MLDPCNTLPANEPTMNNKLLFNNMTSYEKLYESSITQTDLFWDETAKHFVSWFKPWTNVSNCNFSIGQIKWFEGGVLNVCYNCLDRHLEKRGDKRAIIWEANEPGNTKYLTYRELHKQVCKFANVLKFLGVEKGDRVCIYLPMLIESVVAMLACARIGAIHSVVFGGFSPEALRDRIIDGQSKIVITADAGLRGDKIIPLKENVDSAIAALDELVKHVIVVKRTDTKVNWNKDRDIWYHKAMETASADCPPEPLDAEHPLFILYTSGSTGKPKGIVHSTGGYLVYAASTHKQVFDYRENDVYWCSADIGWITGHSYVVYGPLANGATNVIFEGIPTYPTPAILWEIIDKHKVNIFYTAPTLIRSLMAKGNQHLLNSKRDSLRVLGTVGEPINPEAWQWYHQYVGNSNCSIVDTWWQTETGGILISPLAGETKTKPGSATKPLFGITPVILNENGDQLFGATTGILAIANSWPGQMRGIYGDHERFLDTYFKPYPGFYFTGDGAKRDQDGYYWITGRIDDVINVSGHRLCTAEIESALALHPNVAETAVIGTPHSIKGECISAFVKLVEGVHHSNELIEELIKLVCKKIGSIAAPENLHFVSELPKTRSGKIMRRILRKIANKEADSLGDISTLSDPGILADISINNGPEA